ncbi:hypothetical protein DXD84_00700 [Dorea formicigenerans]|uniref:Uncharacterized protein n=1 Tax=Dorea formicigenerans TaxID=39486 RepID=A0A3E4FAB2_9FIRM|nr:hypothetical protein [Dorea formicigenerans]RGI86717.1 hypothetical protein DXD84_00700 [Dorea formicigenerans]RGI89893.1 hypothetical protein DXD82_00700 [Dorea formicigenerans]
MKRNSKRFLALFIAVSMSVTPTTVLHAEESSETDQIQNVEIKQDENIAQEDSETNEKSNSAENSKEEIGKNEQAEVKDTQDNVPVKEEPVSDNTNQENVQENGNQNITSNVEKNDKKNQENQEKESPEQEAAVPEFKAEKVEAVVVNGKIQVTVSTKDENYDKIYIGKKEDSEKTPEVKGEKNNLSGYDFVFETEAEYLGQKLQFVPHLTEKNEWYSEKDLFLDMPAEAQFPELAASVNEVAGANLLSAGEVQSKEVAAGHKTVELIDGASYKVTAETGADMFKVVDCTLVSTKDKGMEAVITLSRQGYDYLYMGRAEEAAEADKNSWIPFNEVNGKYTYTIPVKALNTGIEVASHSKNNNKWYDRTITFKSEGMQFQGLKEGTYEYVKDATNQVYTVTTDPGMFSVTEATLSKIAEGMKVKVTLKGTGYDALYLGSKEDAKKDDGKNWITPCETKGEGENQQYVFEIPVSALNTSIPIATHGRKSKKWFNHTITFNFNTNTVDAGEDQSNSGDNGNNENNGGSNNNGNNGNNSGSGNNGGNTNNSGSNNNYGQNGSDNKYDSNTNGSTGRVNTSTKLADGVYSPDGFLWSGGTGKVSITCSQIRISGGQAYATITFSSSHYQYVKANGSKYLPVSQGGSTTFEIPVELNKNNKIIGMTTAMSQAHEITYSIFVYLAGAQAAEGSSVIGAGMDSESKKLDQDAPSIIGLEYQGEVELNHAQYFKIYEYEQGIKLLEIDLASGTPRENQEDESGEVQQSTEMTQSGRVETKTTDQSKKEEEQTEDGASEASQNQSEQEDKSELYLNNIVKYLIVPDGVEIPVGLDKETIVIQQPTDKTYVASDVILDKLEQLGALNQVKAVASEEKDCTNEIIKNALKDKSVDSIGKYDEPDYKKLIKDECNLTVMDTEILPQEDSETQETLENQLNTMKEILSKYDTLNIPVFIDRSIDEEDELAQAEWLKVYGAIFGCEDKAEAIYAELTK